MLAPWRVRVRQPTPSRAASQFPRHCRPEAPPLGQGLHTSSRRDDRVRAASRRP
jgi:hypothetical protein